MKVAIWDTYVTKKDGSIMHFDIVVPENMSDESQIFNYGRIYLKSKNQEGQEIVSDKCKYCHVEHLQAFMENDIAKNGYFIIEIKGCN